jgi:hypothetical protein
MEPQVSLPCSQNPVPFPYPEPRESNLSFLSYLFKIWPAATSSYSSLPFSFLTKILCAFLFSPARAVSDHTNNIEVPL